MIVYKLPTHLFLLFLTISPAVHAIGGNPDNTWFAVGIYPDSLFADQTVKPTQAFTTFAEARAAMQQAVPFGSRLVPDYTSDHGTIKNHYFHIEHEDVVPGDQWKYHGPQGGVVDSVQESIDAFFAVNQYDCKVEDGPLGGWSEGNIWYCYPPGQPRKVEIATYNLRVLRTCGNSNSYIDVDPVFCRWRKDSCPEHAPHFESNSTDGSYCANHTRAVITEYTCKCNETGISGGCKSIPTQNMVSTDAKQAVHFYQEAVDPALRPIKCPERVEMPGPKQCTVRGNPVNIVTGCKLQNEVDYKGSSGDRLSVKRHYRSSSITAGLDLPPNFVPDLYGVDATLCGTGAAPQESTQAGSSLKDGNSGWYIYKTQYCPLIVLLKPNGEKVLFTEMDNPPDATGTWYQATDPKNGRVKRYSYYYYYYDNSGTTYTFYNDNKLASIEKGGKVTRYMYRYANLEKVVDPYGRYLFYTYDTNNRVTSVRVPDGTYVKYAYDTNGNLVEVTYPDDTPGDDTDNPKKTYLYEDTRFPNALTGIINENEIRYASWEYDEYGRAISSSHDGGVDKYEFEYLDGTTTLVRKYLSDTVFHETTEKHTRYNGVDVITSVENGACADCSVGDITRVYDPNTGNLLSETNAKGITTTFEYDGDHRQTRKVIAAGTLQERVIETVWDLSLNKPSRIIEGGKMTEFSYDSDGNLLSRIEKAAQ